MTPITRKDAKAVGLTRYFTGRPCKRGHVAERFVSSETCSECDRRRGREHYARNRQKRVEYQRKYREENIQDVRAAQKKFYEQNKERKKEYDRKYYAKNCEVKKEYQRDWVKRNPDKSAASVMARRSAKLQRRPNWGCQCLAPLFYMAAREETKRTGIQHHVDHIVPLRGNNVSGLHVASNLQVLKARENCMKGNRHV